MADHYITVVKKLLTSSHGQGLGGFSCVSCSNHLDYSAWNNHQRKEATDPVFHVMGAFWATLNYSPELTSSFSSHGSITATEETQSFLAQTGDRIVSKLVLLVRSRRRIGAITSKRVDPRQPPNHPERLQDTQHKCDSARTR